MSMEYTAPKAKQVRQLARVEDYQTSDGSPNIAIIAGKTGLAHEVVEWILAGEPSLAEETQPEPPQGEPPPEDKSARKRAS